MKKHLSLWRTCLVLLAVLGLFAGCQKETPPGPSEGDGSSDGRGELLPPEDIFVVENVASYRIMRPETTSVKVTDVTKEALLALKQQYSDMRVGTDYTKEPTPIVNDEYEILIGDTNRLESVQAYEEISAQMGKDTAWYHIGVRGNKILLLGSDDVGTAAAVRCFIKQYVLPAEGKNKLEVPKNMSNFYQQYQPEVLTGTDGDVFVTTMNLGSAPYFIDASGLLDVTKEVQNAIDKVNAQGGGVVYLPRGKYRLSYQLVIPTGVTLRGDYADPDRVSVSEGTVLILDGKGSFDRGSALSLASCAAVEGLTIYYEKQSVSAPKVYAPTIETTGDTCTVRDCNLLNSYYGITGGTRPKGMLTIENVKGTCLWRGFDNEQSSDIGIITDVYFSPKYWAGAGEEYGAPAEADIRALMKKNGSIGMTLGDCDRDTYERILLDGFDIGIYQWNKTTRNGLDGSFYDLTILDATIGMDLYSLNGSYGLSVSEATIKASDIAVRNDITAAKVDPKANAVFPFVYLFNCTLEGQVVGLNETIVVLPDAPVEYQPRTHRPVITNKTLFNVADYGIDPTGKTDISEALQEAFDAAAANGGGIVYLPAGRYLLSAPVCMGANTVLMGAHQNPQKGTTTMKGTILFVTHGKNGGTDDTAAITATGDHSGVTGLVVYYPENGVKQSDPTISPCEYSFFLRLTGDESFATDLALVAVSRAVHFDGADSFIADRILMTVYDLGIRATNTSGGLITRIHTNGTYHTMGAEAQKLIDSDWFYDPRNVYTLIDTHLRPRMTLVRVENSDDLHITHVFHYGAKNYLEAVESQIFLLNCESGHISQGKSFVLTGECDILGVNFIRENHWAMIESEDHAYKITIYQYNAANTKILHYSEQ